MTAEFQRDYAILTDYVIPGSARKLDIPEKDGLSIWKVNIFNQRVEQEEVHHEDEDEEHKKKPAQNERKRNLTTIQ